MSEYSPREYSSILPLVITSINRTAIDKTSESYRCVPDNGHQSIVAKRLNVNGNIQWSSYITHKLHPSYIPYWFAQLEQHRSILARQFTMSQSLKLMILRRRLVKRYGRTLAQTIIYHILMGMVRAEYQIGWVS
jgi:hypothetical protein